MPRAAAQTSVTDLDISAHALESAKRNFALNKNFPGVAACRHETVQADAFEWLEKTAEKFDLIVLDPPSLAKRATEREGAIRAYEQLNSLGIAKTGARRNSRGRLLFRARFGGGIF